MPMPIRFNQDNPGWQALRWSFVGIAATLCGMAALIVVRFLTVIRRAGSKYLPWHVITIALSYMILLASTTTETIRRAVYGEPPDRWMLIPRAVGVVIGFVAMLLMIYHLRFESNTADLVENKFNTCHKCGSRFAAKFCARCGALQPGHENDSQ
jgi:hypothetical protein